MLLRLSLMWKNKQTPKDAVISIDKIITTTVPVISAMPVWGTLPKSSGLGFGLGDGLVPGLAFGFGDGLAFGFGVGVLF